MYRRPFLALLTGSVSLALSGCLGGNSEDTREDLEEYVEFEYSLRPSPVGVAMEATATNVRDEQIQFQLRPEVYTDEGEEPADSRAEFVQAGETLELTIPMYLDDEEIPAVTHYIVEINIYSDEVLRVEYEKRHDDFHEQIEE